MTKFYDWQKTFSYNAPLTIVVGARGIGKTYGLRMQCMKDYLKDGSRFVEVFRYRNELKVAAKGYFDKLGMRPEFLGWEFKSNMSGGYCRKAGKQRWHQLCYFVPMTRYQDAKKATFTRVKRIFMDEFIIDKTNQYGRYLPREFAKFSNIVDTVLREQAGDDVQPRAYLLGNALDLVNPYFAALGISAPPEPGYRWYGGKTALVHMAPQSPDAARAKAEQTLAGRLLALASDASETASAIENAFTVHGSSFIEAKAKVRAPVVSLRWKGQPLTVWIKADSEGVGYHVRRGIARECEAAGKAFYFSRDDARIDYRAAKRGEKALAWLAPAFQQGRITFDAPALFEAFTEVLRYFSLLV